MTMLDFFRGLVAGEESASMDEAYRQAASQSKLVLLDIYSPL